MSVDARHAKQIFDQVLDRPPAERSVFLDGACDGDAELRAQVDALLSALDEAGEFLSDPASASAAPSGGSHEKPGAVIDRYKLLQEIGEGGFGTVWMAEQQQPVRRKVAFKVLKLGMDTKQVVARFEVERQALALMDHPNIAKVLDGGATPGGRPYFAMELVKGVPITEYCDQSSLTMPQRLELFQQVCHAVQHAHQKGVIHRDLKPSNILVTLHDGVAVPKVIDFGIAKATTAELTQKTLFTEFRQMIGTPEYMAPEQAELSGLDIDTRADVYSLGVLLYEMVTGTKPFDSSELRQQGYLEMLRVIREQEPPKPSTRISTLGENLTVAAKRRDTSPQSLSRLMRGDVDWIVMKALEKDRNRRYATAHDLSADIGRHLADEPVHASPPNAVYRLRKYVRRHRVGVAAGAAVLVALVAGLAAATWGFLEARDQRDNARVEEETAKTETARANAVIELITEMLGSANPQEVKDRDYTVRQLLEDFDRDFRDQLRSEPEVKASLRRIMGRSFLSLGMPDRAEPHLDAALAIRERVYGADHELVADALVGKAWLLNARAKFNEALQLLDRAEAMLDEREGGEETLESLQLLRSRLLADLGHYDEGERLARENLARAEQRYGKQHMTTAARVAQLANLCMYQGKLEEAERLHRRALAVECELFGDDHPKVALVLNNLAGLLRVRYEFAEAEQMYRDALQICRKWFVEHDARVTMYRHHVGLCLMDQGRLVEAETLCRDALAADRQHRGPDHPRVAWGLTNVARTLKAQGKHADALAMYREALQIRRRAFGSEHPTIARSLIHVGIELVKLGQFDEAEARLREGVAMRCELLAPGHRDIASGLNSLGVVLDKGGKYGEAEEVLREALELRRKLVGAVHREVASTLSNLGSVLARQGKNAEAEPLHREALAVREQLLDRDHPEISDSLQNLGAALSWQGKHRDAEPLFRRALAIRTNHFGSVHPEVAFTLRSFAATLLSLRKYEEAEAELRRLIEMEQAIGGEKHPRVAHALNRLGTVLNRQGKYADAEAIYRRGLAMTRELGEDEGILALRLNNLAANLQRQRKHREARPLFEEALELRRRIHGEDHLRVGLVLNNLATVLGGLGELTAAAAMTRQSLAIARKHRGPKHAEVAHRLTNLGAHLHRLGEDVEAEAVLREALVIRRELSSADDPWLATTLRRLAEVLEAKGELTEAEPLAAEALAVVRRAYPMGDPRTVVVLERFGSILLAREKYREAEAVLAECLEIPVEKLADPWLHFRAMSLLGEVRTALEQYASAEPLLLEGYERMQPPKFGAKRKTEALQRIVELYEAWGKADKATEWRQALAAAKRDSR